MKRRGSGEETTFGHRQEGSQMSECIRIAARFMTHLHFDSTYGDCDAYRPDRCKLRATETGAAREARGDRRRTESVVFVGVLEGALTTTPPTHHRSSNIHANKAA